MVGSEICARAAARGVPVRSELADAVLDLAFAAMFSDTLLDGAAPDSAARERLVDGILLPALLPGPR